MEDKQKDFKKVIENIRPVMDKLIQLMSEYKLSDEEIIHLFIGGLNAQSMSMNLRLSDHKTILDHTHETYKGMLDFYIKTLKE